MEQCENVDRERIVDDYRSSIIQSIEHDENHPGTWTASEVRDSQALREQYNEQGKQLDANEAAMKSEYDNNHCEEVTGQTSDEYRHQVVEDYTHEHTAGSSAAENQGDDYWDETGKREGSSAESQNVAQNEQADYWAGNNAGNSSVNENNNENENSLSNEASC